ncbi:MAG: YcxB family protein, partial [Cyanobacteriota bacterium]|nr:YcxB family protein [Cyanobacteriota bacterium]
RIFTSYYYSSIKRNAKKMLREGSGKGIIGEHILELTNTEIIERTNFNEMKTNIASLERVETSSVHAFIYISSIHAHVIPRSSIIEGNFEAFLQELNRKIEQIPQSSEN